MIFNILAFIYFFIMISALLKINYDKRKNKITGLIPHPPHQSTDIQH